MGGIALFTSDNTQSPAQAILPIETNGIPSLTEDPFEAVSEPKTTAITEINTATNTTEVISTENLLDFSDITRLVYQPKEGAKEYLHLVSRFTTHHPCCATRVTNIQTLADTLDQTVVAPGEIFSLNQAIGERTEEKGFASAGTIMGGELVDTVGGGVSQFATTLYNAVYWAGLKDISHQPHSWQFDRYPTGIEATISWPNPDLKFQNDTNYSVIIHTSHSGTSITVEIWGNNDGRIAVGDHKNGKTSTEILAEGGENSRVVTSYVTPTYLEINDIPTIIYPNLAIRPGFAIEMKSGTPGAIMNVFRTITVGDQETVNTWKVRYKPTPKEIHVHPCSLTAKDRVHEYGKYDYSSLDCSIIN